MVLSVCIPYAGKEPALLEEAAESAARSLPGDSELLVLADGPHAAETAARARLPGTAKVLASDEPLGLCGNWNRCLESAGGELLHLLHDDDRVLEGFYGAVLDLRARFPDASLYATGYAPLVEGRALPAGDASGDPRLFEGMAAARALLIDERHTCGSVVIPRSAVERDGAFDPSFPYCPDEEAYLRWARHGGLAFQSAPLYLNRPHAGQTRWTTWAMPDFVPSYLAARTTGAGPYGREAERLAEDSTAHRVIRLARALSLQGAASTAAARLADLRGHVPRVRVRPAYWVAWGLARSDVPARLAGVIRGRRRARRAA